MSGWQILFNVMLGITVFVTLLSDYMRRKCVRHIEDLESQIEVLDARIEELERERAMSEYDDWDDRDDDRSMFADPGGKSALRAASKSNPRNLPCPTCKRPNMLTPKDRALGYQCDICANEAEGGGW